MYCKATYPHILYVATHCNLTWCTCLSHFVNSNFSMLLKLSRTILIRFFQSTLTSAGGTRCSQWAGWLRCLLNIIRNTFHKGRLWNNQTEHEEMLSLLYFPPLVSVKPVILSKKIGFVSSPPRCSFPFRWQEFMLILMQSRHKKCFIFCTTCNSVTGCLSPVLVQIGAIPNLTATKPTRRLPAERTDEKLVRTADRNGGPDKRSAKWSRLPPSVQSCRGQGSSLRGLSFSAVCFL